jgi:hypothetical protein
MTEYTFGYIEYGVVQDRTAQGLGYLLMTTQRDKVTAEQWADNLRRTTDNPVSVKVRSVAVSEWQEVD